MILSQRRPKGRVPPPDAGYAVRPWVIPDGYCPTLLHSNPRTFLTFFILLGGVLVSTDLEE